MKVLAKYEDGVLKPKVPLPLPEHAEVEVDVDVEPGGAMARTPRAIPREKWEKAIGCVAIGGDAVADSERYYDDP